MRGKEKREAKEKRGFTWPEMALLLVTMAVFLAGTVLVVNGAIAKSHPFGKSEGAGREGEATMNKIAAMVGSGREFYIGKGARRLSSGEVASGSLDFLADLDSDPETGSYEVGNVRGLERATITRRGNSIVVFVRSGPAAPTDTVVLTRDLAPGDPGAFEVGILSSRQSKQSGQDAATPPTVSRVRLSITTGSRGSRLVVTRNIDVRGNPPLRPAP
ncbi:MAG: hypothetical protein ACYC99_08160 [Candidatus Geothermincolia bacterium]